MICVPGECMSSMFACLREPSHLPHHLLIKLDFLRLTFCLNMSRFMARKIFDIFQRCKEYPLRSSKISQFISIRKWTSYKGPSLHLILWILMLLLVFFISLQIMPLLASSFVGLFRVDLLFFMVTFDLRHIYEFFTETSSSSNFLHNMFFSSNSLIA